MNLSKYFLYFVYLWGIISSFKFVPIKTGSFLSLLTSKMTETLESKVPIAIVVNVEIEKERLQEFLKIIELDAIGSRERENGGCLRFDVLRDKTNECKFIFYEVYVNEDAFNFHQQTGHFKLWADFKASGGVVSVAVVVSDALFFG
jgi:quinol monooxygenase YgiN